MLVYQFKTMFCFKSHNPSVQTGEPLSYNNILWAEFHKKCLNLCSCSNLTKNLLFIQSELKYFFEKQLLNQTHVKHVINTSNIFTIKIPNDNNLFTINQQYLKYFLLFVGASDYLNPEFCCPTCGRKYRHKKDLKRHIDYECGKEPQFHCPVCSKRFKRKSTLYQHARDIHHTELCSNTTQKNVNNWL